MRPIAELTPLQPEMRRPVSNVCLMDFITILLIAMVLGTIVLAPKFGTESRRCFLRPDLKPNADWSPARPWSWDS